MIGGDRRPVAVVLRALGIGDLCTAVPALRSLHRHLPHELVLATPRWLAPLRRVARLGDRHLPMASLSSPWPAGLAPVALAVNLHGHGPPSTTRLGELAPSRLVSHRAPGSGSGGGRPWNPDEHDRVRWCSLVTEELGFPADPDDLRFEVHGTDPDPRRALVHLGAASPARRWPTDRFAAVVLHLVGAGWSVDLTAGPTERHLGEAVVGALPAQVALRVRDRSGTTSVADLVATVASAGLVVCGDTGVAHLATGLGRPSVVLFGPISPSVWGPPPWGPHEVLWAGRLGDPHGATADPGLLELAVGDVIAAIGRLELAGVLDGRAVAGVGSAAGQVGP